MIYDRLFVIFDMRTGKRVGVASYLTEADAEMALDVMRRAVRRKTHRRDLIDKVDNWFVDEWIEHHE